MLRLIIASALVLSAAFSQTPVVADGGVLNGASFARGQGVAPGSIVSIFGTELASGLATGDSLPLSASIGVVSVTINDIAAPLYFVSGGQINAQVPWNVLPQGTTSGSVPVIVKRGGAVSQTIQASIVAAAPGIFSIPAGVGNAVAINADGSLAAPAGSIPGINTRPAKVGETIIVLASGLGAVNPPNANGAASLDALRTAIMTPTVFIGGVQAPLVFAGLSPQFPGVNQLNVTIPGVGAGPAVPIQILSNGIRSTDQVTIAVSQ